MSFQSIAMAERSGTLSWPNPSDSFLSYNYRTTISMAL